MNGDEAYDVVLVGGGLANGLIAYRLRTERPDLRVLVLEAGDQLGGNHTWSFHESDLTADESAWFEPFVVHRWPAYDVAFPRFVRRMPLGYRSVTSERFRDVLGPALGDSIVLKARVAKLDADSVLLEDGRQIRAGAVVDGRGYGPSPHRVMAWQKFVGMEFRFARPHALAVPILMDATVAQKDGYRFVYVLPFGPDRALVEDTYYANASGLDDEAIYGRIHAYLDRRGWQVAEVLRRERGALPITLAGDVEAFWREADTPRSGLRAGLFHPTTGYSLPDAIRLADMVASLSDLSAPALAGAIRDRSVALWRSQGIFRLVNRMLFWAGPAEDRYRMLQRFYTLPEGTIRRFYEGRLTRSDKARLLVGRPPAPFVPAVRAALGYGAAA